MQTQQIPTTQQIRTLERHRQQLEQRLERCRAAAGDRNRPNPSLGRVADDTRARLAKVRAELEQLARR